jgi:hypothetical protein
VGAGTKTGSMFDAATAFDTARHAPWLEGR